LAWLGHPVAGDQIYGRRTKLEGLSRQFLHAGELTLHHPISGNQLSIAAPLPADLKSFLKTLR
jgi:23S rRNA pseudouridine1911/1915/1917 synthase